MRTIVPAYKTLLSTPRMARQAQWGSRPAITTAQSPKSSTAGWDRAATRKPGDKQPARYDLNEDDRGEHGRTCSQPCGRRGVPEHQRCIEKIENDDPDQENRGASEQPPAQSAVRELDQEV